MIILGRR